MGGGDRGAHCDTVGMVKRWSEREERGGGTQPATGKNGIFGGGFGWGRKGGGEGREEGGRGEE